MGQLMELQNGSDIRGVACEGVPGERVNLTENEVNVIGQAFADWLAEQKRTVPGSLRIGVGHDSRVTADVLKTALFRGLTGRGARVADCGLVSTPSMFMTQIYPSVHFDGGIMITASHLPFNRNGLKFFTGQGGLEKEDITEILLRASSLEPCAGSPQQAEQMDTLSVYIEDLKGKIIEGVKNAPDRCRPLAGLHIVTDAGNGAGGFFPERVLAPLGADISGSLYLDPNGMFPNHVPNPENQQAMEVLRQAVMENRADLGLIFDTDVDRMSAVLSDGEEINRDRLIAMMAAILQEDYPGGTIVTDSVTSDRLTRFLEQELGMRHRRYKRGYKNVINEGIRLNREGILTPLAIETSGHGAMKENYFLDDGAYMAVRLLIAAANARQEGRSLASYIEKMEDSREEREYRIKIQAENFREYGDRVLEVFEKRAKMAGYNVVPDSCEGVRLAFRGDEIRGWLLLRMSLHDPILPLNMEGERDGDCDRMTEAVKRLLEGFSELGWQ